LIEIFADRADDADLNSEQSARIGKIGVNRQELWTVEPLTAPDLENEQ
jgi:hypothetical protein